MFKSTELFFCENERFENREIKRDSHAPGKLSWRIIDFEYCYAPMINLVRCGNRDPRYDLVFIQRRMLKKGKLIFFCGSLSGKVQKLPDDQEICCPKTYKNQYFKFFFECVAI